MKRSVLRELNEAREALLAIPKDELDGRRIWGWHQERYAGFRRAEHVANGLIDASLYSKTYTYVDVVDTEVLNELRVELVELIDEAIARVDAQQIVRAVLEHWIAQVQDPKLATLLREFNLAREVCPNVAAIGFRTILSLIIFERAKRAKPASKLAQQQDINFERDIKAALAEDIFSRAETRLLQRFLTGGKKDKFDIVAHKVGSTAVIEKEDLEDAVDLLNSLLPTIVGP